MKTLKKIFSMLLCAALLLSSAPILNFSLFRTDAAAVSYAKTHTKEYYYAQGTQFIMYLATGGDRDGNTAKAKVTDSGYTLIDKNLNAGVKVSSGLFSSRAADEVYLGYKTSSDPTASIRDLRIMLNKGDDRYTCPENGAAYTLVGLTPVSEKDNDGGGSVDLNQSKSSSDYLHYFATKDIRVGAPIVSITINNNDSMAGYETVKYLNSDDFNLAADANRDAGGEYIYTHLTRLPEVDTTALRSAMETADTYIANSQLYVDIAALTAARDNAKKITDSYDSYAAGYEAFSMAYNQAAIDNAKTAIDNAIKALLTKLDWSAFNAAVSKANGLNKNDYVDFSSVENALKNAELVKSSFTAQEQVDSETAKINTAVNALVKKSTASSMVQSTAYGEGVFRSSVKLSINNVNIGTSCDYWEKSDVPVGDVETYKDGKIMVYQKTAQNVSERWNASKATIYVDPDVTSDILSTGINIQLTMPWVYSSLSKARWGVELAQYANYYNLGTLEENMRSATVTSTNGKSLTYTLCDASGNDMASAETNSDFTQDAAINANGGAYGPYTWYIKGAVPAAGDKAVVRVLGICAAWAYSDNLQKLTEFTDLTIVSVSKTALKKAIYTVVGNESVYTSDSYAAYVTALNAAKAVLNDATAEQTTVDAATTKLNNAINALQAILDMSGLYAARDKANSLNGSDYEDFSEVANLVGMIPNTVFNTQQEVDDYADRLNYAISKLVKKTTSGSLSVGSEQLTVYPGMARNVNNMILYGASKVSDNSFSRYGYEGESDVNCPPTELSFSNGHGGQDIHRIYQKSSDSAANAYYVFDRYDNNATDMSSVNNMIELYMYGEAQSHQHSVALYDGTYNESNFTNFDTGKTTQAVTSPNTGKHYSYSLVGGGLYYNWENTQYLTTHKRYLSLQGPVPDVGDAVQLRIVYRNGTFCFDGKTGLFYYGWVTVNMLTVDSTALRNAIALSKNVLDKSAYSESSYNTYRTALSEASEALNGSAVPSQDNYNAKTTALINAINNLERIQTVTLDSRPAATAGTASVVATIGKAMPAITIPTREHYTFDGYFTQPNGEGVQYYNADGSSVRDFDLEGDVTLYASWSADKFDIKFVNYDGTVLRNGKVAYGTKPVYDGDEPAKPSDDSYEYTFSGWSPEIAEVTSDAAYTAQFTEKAHRFYYSPIDDEQHEDICMDCNYKKPAENHTYIYKKLSDTRYGYWCKDCGYSYTKQVGNIKVEFACSDYSAAVNSQIVKDCKYSAEYNNEKSVNYPIVTIKAPLTITSNGQTLYFVYWKDADTNEIVGTYTTYKYFQTKQTMRFTPVYAAQKDYYAKRNTATIASRVVDCRLNDDGSYSLLAEHSVASSCESILGHGVIYTTDSANAGALTVDNDNVQKKMASTSANALTGLLEVSINVQGASTVWARTYVIDANGEVHYGTTRSFAVTADTASAGEVITLGAESYDLTDINSDAEAPTIEDEPTEKTPLEILKTIFSKLIEIINEIISYFTKPGAKK